MASRFCYSAFHAPKAPRILTGSLVCPGASAAKVPAAVVGYWVSSRFAGRACWDRRTGRPSCQTMALPARVPETVLVKRHLKTPVSCVAAHHRLHHR